MIDIESSCFTQHIEWAHPLEDKMQRRTLLVIALALTLAGWLLFPQRSNISTPPPFSVDFFTESELVTTTNVGVTPGEDADTLHIYTVLTRDDSGIPDKPSLGLVEWIFPVNVEILKCGPDCKRAGGDIPNRTLVQYLTWSPSKPGSANCPCSVVAAADIRAEGWFPTYSNGVQAGGVIPHVQGLQSSRVILTMPLEQGFELQEGPVPLRVGRDRGTITWDLAREVEDTLFKAVNYSAQERDQTLLFLSGITLGLAGSALIAALQTPAVAIPRPRMPSNPPIATPESRLQSDNVSRIYSTLAIALTLLGLLRFLTRRRSG